MSIHSEHPFATPEADRDPVRRLRGRLPAAVTIWATGDQHRRAGLTVSSMMIAEGDPGELVGLINSDSDLAELLASTGRVAVSVLGWSHRQVADVFAGLAPSPGGPFRTGRWHQTDWGPVLDGAVAWAAGDLVNSIPSKARPWDGPEAFTGSTDRTAESGGPESGDFESGDEDDLSAHQVVTAAEQPLPFAPRAGWSLLAQARIARLEIADFGDDADTGSLALFRGAYQNSAR